MDTEKLNLKREVGLMGAVSLIGGTMIGSGIFMTPQTVLSSIGSPGASLVVWGCCGFLVILVSFCYAELGTVIRESGGEYIYILKTSGPVVAFMLIFTSVLFVRPAGVAGIALGFAQYATAPFYSGLSPSRAAVQVFFMVTKVLVLVVIIIGGVVMLIRGHNENFEDSFENTNVGINPIGIAFYQGLWSYDGWNNLNYVTEELKRPEYVLSTIGSPGASLIMWVCCGLLSMLGGLCYAELGTVIPESGGEFTYILRTAGRVFAFMFVFTFIIVMRPASATGIALSFAEYVVAPFYGCSPPQLVVKCVAAGGILVLAIVNSLSVRLATVIQVVSMVVKLLAMAVIILGGVVMLFQGHTENFENSFEGTNVGVNSIGIAFYQGLWSYDGWNTLNYVTEEVKHPEFILAYVESPGASLVIWALSGVVAMFAALSYTELGTVIPESGGEFIYILRIYGSCPAFFTAYTFILVVKPFSMAATSISIAEYIVAPFYSDCHPPQLVVKNKVLGSWGWIMSVASALSAFGSLNGTFFSGGRMCFVAAREGHMPHILAMAHVRRLTPSPALIFTTFISLLVLIPGDFQSIVNFFSFTAWFFYAITLGGLLYLKIKKPELHRPYKVPIVIPILVLIAAVFLVLAPIIDDPQIEYLYVTLFILSGAIVYVPFIHYKLFPDLFTKLTVFLQLFLEVAPAEKNL
ncbi:b(0,+)-type amino acid transporter 1 [Collichthys lucidus]|uniref:B(0,+)-type amino acid transporter 1 n=1 Tax=Collichthys lucidus TaxID=240159 RepID=A0A4U5VEA2_COLLU|nr:b(0,+)-type amino acid transporter 1 [Collichthys lucidus]